MVSILSGVLFVGAFGFSATLIVASIAPQWRRIVRLASGQVQPVFAPLQTLAEAEQRIAVRRWASAPVPASIRRMRAAA